jgi:hypothetical protein
VKFELDENIPRHAAYEIGGLREKKGLSQRQLAELVATGHRGASLRDGRDGADDRGAKVAVFKS